MTAYIDRASFNHEIRDCLASSLSRPLVTGILLHNDPLWGISI